jgi:hypothetical protein
MRKFIFALILLAIIFSAISLFVPWWSLNTSSEVSAILNSTIKTDYYLQQNVVAVKTVNNVTEIQNVPLGNLTGTPESVGPLSLWLSATYIVTISGLGLSCLMLIVVALPKLDTIFHRYATFIGYIAALLLLIAPVLLAMNFSSAIAELSRLTPLDIPPTWTPISAGDINGFWGNIRIQTTSSLPEWTIDGNFWVWGADAGWYLTFTASILMLLASLLNRALIKKEVMEEKK